MTSEQPIPLAELPAADAAAVLLRNMQAATAAVTSFGGWPPCEDVIRVLREWFAEFDLSIDDEPPEPRRA